jgi:hypothetical protein
MSIRNVLRAFFGNTAKSTQLQAEIREGIANHADLTNRRLKELIDQQANHAMRNEKLLKEVVEGLASQTQVLNQQLKELTARGHKQS